MIRFKNAAKATSQSYTDLCKPIPAELRITIRTLWYGIRDIVVSLLSLITIPLLWLLATLFLVVVFLRNYLNEND